MLLQHFWISAFTFVTFAQVISIQDLLAMESYHILFIKGSDVPLHFISKASKRKVLLYTEYTDA